MENVKKGKYNLVSSPFDKVSKTALDLIKKLLVMDKDKRISAKEALHYKLFNQIDINGDGKITEEKLLKGLSTKIKLSTVKNDVDMDNMEFIEYEEFVRSLLVKKKL